MCAPRVTRHTSIRYSSSCYTHASTWVHRYSSLLQRSVALGQRGHVAMVLGVLCTKCTLHSNHRLNCVIFQHTKQLFPRSGHFLTAYTRISSAEMWTQMKNNLLGKKCFLTCSFYLCMFREYVSYRFPIINFRNPGVRYETLCTCRRHEDRITLPKHVAVCCFSQTSILLED